MNIIFFVVNFNADEHLFRLIKSIEDAKSRSQQSNIEVHVFENSPKTEVEINTLKIKLRHEYSDITLHWPKENKGYFGGVSTAQSVVKEQTNCVIYCNPDVMLDSNFLSRLEESRFRNEGIIAPAIIGIKDEYDQNPKYINRLSKNKLKRLKVIYSNKILYEVFNLLAKMKELVLPYKSDKRNTENVNQKIYAPHGSVLIFMDTKFFCKLPLYPCLLFGEELFIAEEARMAKVNVTYQPLLIVHDVRHASIKQIGNNFRRSLMFSSVSFILDRYYK